MIYQELSKEFNIKEEYSKNIINLIDEGCTIPFIARYRKELTGKCDDQTLREFSDRLTYLRNLYKRKEEVATQINEQGKLTEEIKNAILAAVTLTEVEDIYRPFKPKRKTRATVAVAKGLQPLADIIIAQEIKEGSLEEIAMPFIDAEKGVNNAKEAVEGASDIIAEAISDRADIRKDLRTLLFNKGIIKTTFTDKNKDQQQVYSMYEDFSETIKTLPSHRILAINRGEKEDCLKVKVDLDIDLAVKIIAYKILKGESLFKSLIMLICEDSFKRLIFPSISNEVRNDITNTANEQAIKMFEENLKPLLMQPPLKGKNVLGLDPAYRTGCKIAVIDSTGKVLATTVVYPTPPQSKTEEAKKVLLNLIDKHNVEVIAIGNGTASRESELFVAEMIKESGKKLSYAMVNEAGASVYSASKLGAEEFPEFDVSLRSAVSIARRLVDPLAELVKIDPKSIGVGQYQHDMPQNRLSEVLNGVMEDCVNRVGVDLNTASYSLLSCVSGLNTSLAKNIVVYRETNGAFKNRNQLKKVPKLGEKTFEQCAGFLRIAGGDNILDNTAVHPESYPAVKIILDNFGYTSEDVKEGKLITLPLALKNTDLNKLAQKSGIGVETLEDVINELMKPGRDVRDTLPKPHLRSDILDMKDLKEGMVLTGTVRNVIDFGAFIDIGVHQDGLVHISEISDKYIKHPNEVLKVGDIVDVYVLGVDVGKKRISLSIKKAKNQNA